ncbi:hypothetical protein [Lentibacter sp.]|uniref:hypothetical protein n=1 Tax=Lentibacter sp. TaxID=2024994 RepID=UPI003F6C50FC
MTNTQDLWPELSLPDAEASYLRGVYSGARVILEYGSGGSTTLAASLAGKRVFSVESDKAWALRLQTQIDAQDLPSPTTLYHADIGPTGAWGRPLDGSHWQLFHTYPLAIWDQPYFLEPDVVLIDGRFRVACLMTTLARITKPVTILFDDYTERPSYHVVERYIKPSETVGRMAVFEAKPGLVTLQDLSEIVATFMMASFVGESGAYDKALAKLV